MIRGVVRLLMAWLLVGSPVLCKAGVLVACCDHQSVLTSDYWSSESSCCNDAENGFNGEPCAPDSPPRECGACAGVCGGAVKPSDESKAASLPAQSVCAVAIGIVPTISLNPRPFSFHSLRVPRLPFPRSDLPLLI